jgi:hypothetical protein
MRFALLTLFAASAAFAQFNAQKGLSAPAPTRVEVQRTGDDGKQHTYFEQREAPRDSHGNASGATYDLAVDGAFDGQTVLVVDLYGQDFSRAAAALKQKGFSTVRHTSVPSVETLRTELKKSNQFWILASCSGQVHLTAAHRAAIKEFFDAGHGVYLWGDNDPCNADADKLASELIDARVQGDLPGDQVVAFSKGAGKAGITKDHQLTTGLEYIYEGITVATVKPVGNMTPIVYGSAGNLVTAAFEQSGKRLIVDGGYTRLSNRWDTAGTGRYVMNAAAWLANYERFGKEVVADRFKK